MLFPSYYLIQIMQVNNLEKDEMYLFSNQKQEKGPKMSVIKLRKLKESTNINQFLLWQQLKQIIEAYLPI